MHAKNARKTGDCNNSRMDGDFRNLKPLFSMELFEFYKFASIDHDEILIASAIFWHILKCANFAKFKRC